MFNPIDNKLIITPKHDIIFFSNNSFLLYLMFSILNTFFERVGDFYEVTN